MSEFPGARWWKFDFHTHTAVSSDFMNGRSQRDKDAFTNKQWLKACMDAELDCVVVTDHNGGGAIDELRAEYARMQGAGEVSDRPLIIFPGAEISSSSGIHILGILDPSKGSTEVSALVGACGYRGQHGDSETCANETPINIVKTIEETFHGVAILAHVDTAKGFWSIPPQDGNHILDRDRMLAVEQRAFAAFPPQWIADRKPLLTHVAGSDCHFRNPGDIPGAGFTWIKMGQPSIEGLRMALLDGDGVSVWHSGNPELPDQPGRAPESWFESLEVQGTKLMGRKGAEILHFSPWMNAIIGGRGTGKSSIVHFLRRLLDQDEDLGQVPTKDSENLLRKIFEEFMRFPRKRDDKGILSGDTRLCLILRHEGHRFRITWKQDGTKSVEAEEGTGWRLSESQEVRKRFKAQLYSQGQVADLAEKGASLLDHLDGKADTDPVKVAFQEAQSTVREILTRRRAIERKITERGAMLAQFEDTKLKLAQFESHDHAATLKEFQKRQRQGTEIQKQREAAASHIEAIDLLADGLVQPGLSPELFEAAAPEDQEVVALQMALRDAVLGAKAMIQAASAQIQTASAAFQEGTRSGEWGKAREAIKAKYSELTQGLKSKGIQDPSEYGRLVQDRQRIEAGLKAFDSFDEQISNLDAELEVAMARLSEARWAISRHRAAFLERTLHDNPFIRIEVEPLGRNEEMLEAALRNVLQIPPDGHNSQIFQEEGGRKTGAVADILRSLPADNQEAGIAVEEGIKRMKAKIVASAAGTSRVFGGKLDPEIQKKAQARPEFLDEVRVWFPEDTLKVRYSPEGKGGNWKPIVQASKGQKSSALLAFLLSHGNETLVLDQPEDDLDNHLIFSLVVRQLQRLKAQRQVIVVTHNANIVVNGDSEYVHVMAYEGGQCSAKQTGCLQEKATREEICEVMEGGQDAFKLRYRRMNLERA